MNEAEKERLIKKDIVSIENRVRHAFNQGYEMGMKESSSENPNKWIPVSKRLPEVGEYVGDVAKYYLVQNEYGDMLVARYTHSEYWEQIYRNKPYADEVVAWMPLPTPFRAESEVQE